jgi:hypothetical protein
MTSKIPFVQTSKASVFCFFPSEFTPNKNYYQKIKLTEYLKKRNISRKQVNYMIRKRLLGITRYQGRIWVHELDDCTDLIKLYLDVDTLDPLF